MLRRHSCPAQQAYKPTKVTLCIQMAAPFTNGLIAHLPGINLINCCRRFKFSVQTPFRMHNYKYSRLLITPASASIGVATNHQLIIILLPNRLIGQLSITTHSQASCDSHSKQLLLNTTWLNTAIIILI